MTNNKKQAPSTIKKDYFRWLCDIIEGITDSPRTSYRGLLYTLFEKEFYHFVPNDDNRSSDGVKLREEYIRLKGLDKPERKEERIAIQGICKVLEMMVALAKRCEDDIMYSPENGDRTRVWFFTMIKNLGLDIYYDENFDCKSQANISRVIDIAVNREYSENGDGGFFPLKNPSQDQTKVEIWFQMVAWLNENYFEEWEEN